VEIVNVIDDHSRLAVASRVLKVATAAKALEVFLEAGARWGLPAALLTDNGCIYTTWHRGGPNVMQTELLALGIDYRHSRPYHPQTCGKVERFHQTMKAFLTRQPRARSVAGLQVQVDRFVAYYNEVRPHRARGRMTPRAAFEAREKARTRASSLQVEAAVLALSPIVLLLLLGAASPGYLNAYRTGAGTIVAVVGGGLIFGCYLLMRRLGRVPEPRRTRSAR